MRLGTLYGLTAVHAPRAGGLRTVAVEREGLRAMESEKGAMEGGEIVKRMMQRCNERSEKVINRRVGLYVRSE